MLSSLRGTCGVMSPHTHSILPHEANQIRIGRRTDLIHLGRKFLIGMIGEFCGQIGPEQLVAVVAHVKYLRLHGKENDR